MYASFALFYSPLILLAISQKPKPRWKMQPDKIFVRTMYFGRPPEISHWSIIDGNTERLLTWFATYIYCPFFEERTKKHTESVISTSVYIPIETPKDCWDEDYHYQYDAKTGGCNPYNLEIDTIDCPNLPLLFLYLGTLRGIFGPSTQLPRPIASEWLVRLCNFDALKYSSWQ